MKRGSPWVWGLVILSSLLLVTSCSGRSKNTLIYWHPFAPGTRMGMAEEKLIAEFEKQHPDIKVKALYVSWQDFDTKLQTAIAGKTPPGVAMIDRFVTATYAYRQALTPLNQYFDKLDMSPSDFWDATWNEATWQGQLWAVPHHTDVRALYYRTDHFEEVGLDPNKPPRDWKELYEYAWKLTKRDENGNFVRIGFMPHWGNWYIYGWGWINGGHFISPDGRKITCNDPKIVEALQWEVNFIKSFGYESVEAFGSSYSGGQSFDLFIAGKLSMKIDGDWYMGDLKKWGPDVPFKVAPPPPPKKGMPTVSWSGGFALAIPAGVKGKQLEMALEFIKFRSHYEAQATFGKLTGAMPALIKAAKDVYVDDPRKEVFLKLMKVTKYRPVTPVAKFYWDKVIEAEQKAIAGLATPQEALNRAAEMVQKELDKTL